MGYVQTREHESENCYVYISREELRETYAELKRLARIDRIMVMIATQTTWKNWRIILVK